MEFLLNNWWLIFMIYGIYKAVTKKSAQARRVEMLRDADARRALGTAEADETAAEKEAAEVYADGDEAEVRTVRRGRMRPQNDNREYQFVDPVAEEERADKKARMAAYNFQLAENATLNDLALLDAKRELQESLKQVYSIPSIAATSSAERSNALGITPDEIRRAIILTEILQPPRSRRPHR